MTDEKKTGFAAMSSEEQRALASAAGKKAHAMGVAHVFTTETAKLAGAKGGAAVSRDREHMARIGRKGGLAVSANRQHMSEIGHKGGKVAASALF